jgi:hypothetical protein
VKDNRPYVYALLVDGTVRYVGKGRNGRMDDHVKAAVKINAKRTRGEKIKTTKFYNRLAKALRSGAEIKTQVLAWFATDERAFTEEIRQIAGRDGLWNTWGGGQGASSEWARENSTMLFAPDRKQKMIAGKKKQWADDDEFRERQAAIASEKLKKKWDDPDFRKMKSENSSVTAAKLWASPDALKRLSPLMKEGCRIREADAGFRKRRADGIAKLWDGPDFRFRRSTEISESNRRRVLSPEALAKMSASAKLREARKREAL